MIDQHDIDRLRRLSNVEDRIGHPVDAGHVLRIELDLFPQSAAQTLHDVALDRVLEPIGIDDLAAVVSDRELAAPDLARAAVDVYLGHNRDAGATALRVGDAAAADAGPGLVT